MHLAKFVLIIALLTSFYSCKPINAQETNTTNHTDTTMNTLLIQPNYLKKGDTVAIVAPSGILINKEREIKQAKELLNSWELEVVIGEHVFAQNGHFAGTDKQRGEDFQNALDNSSISAIWVARGGYGTVRVLDQLNFTQFKKHPKWLIGYSDITALHNTLHNEGYQSIHALMCTSLTKDLNDVKDNIESLRNALFGNSVSYTFKGSEYNKTGIISGPLVGGNLTLLHTMLGSKTSIDTEGKILFIEEIGEYAYHIDRMLQSLKRAGYFEGLNGLVVGDISRIRENTTEFGRTIEELILDVVEPYNFPVAFNAPAGHEDNNRALILGRDIELQISKEKSTIIFKE